MATARIDIWEKCEECCCPLPPRQPKRTVRLNRQPTSIDTNEHPEKFPSNKIVTSRYTWWNFVPKNLLEQFMRLAYTYFLFIALAATFNTDTPTFGPAQLGPICVLLLFNAVKEGYEDIVRHKKDRKVNHLHVEVVTGDVIAMVKSEDLCVGDVICVRKNQQIPCDAIILSTSSSTGECFVTTASLDGESNLRRLKAVRPTVNLTKPASLSSVRGIIECEQPTANLYTFSGRILLDTTSIGSSDEAQDSRNAWLVDARAVVTDQPVNNSPVFTNPTFGAGETLADQTIQVDGTASGTLDENNNVKVLPLDENNLLLRGARLSNSEFAFGCVVYTGRETKLALNTRARPMKLSCVERQANTFLIAMCIFLLIITFMSLGLVYYYRYSAEFVGAWYLTQVIPEDSAGRGALEWLNYVILYNSIIAIGLYMFIELVKFIASLFISWDELMYDPKSQQRALANTSDLVEELGQVEYLFCDKTGTLTENELVFRECFVNGTRYVDQNGQLFMRMAPQKRGEEIISADPTQNTSIDSESDAASSESPEFLLKVTKLDDRLTEFLSALALCHTGRVDRAEEADIMTATKQMMSRRKSSSPSVLAEAVSASPANQNSTVKQENGTSKAPNSASVGNAAAPSTSLSNQETQMMNVTGAMYEYQASSPDEKALLIAARQYGVVYHGAIDDTIMLTKCKTAQVEENETARSDWSVERYRLRHVLEFDAVRKCMSVIVETERGEYWLITKGAEVSMSERARRPNGSGSGSGSGSESKQEEIMEEVREYASRGLRTLVIGRRRLGRDEFERIDKRIREAQLVIENRAEALAAAYGETEQGLELLGATGVEDRLQEGVEETIEKLRQAGIVVWVLTGDKEESAVDVAYACGLFDEETRLVRVTQQADAETCLRTLQTLQEQVTEESKHFAKGLAALSYGMVIDGVSLLVALDEEANDHKLIKSLLLNLCLNCASVVACRMTPIQKAAVVKLIKCGVKGAVTCAIGDGANDVSMIEEAHVGLGIFGKEGRQAAQTSDYCFSRFRHLNRVFLLHGHYFYHRLAILVLYFFYKNIVYTLNQFLLQYLCAASQTSLYDMVTLTVFNLCYTTIPIIIYGLLEQHINRDALLRKPELYRRIRRNSTLEITAYVRWMLLGIYQAVVIAFGSYIYFQFANESTLPDGQPLDWSTFGSFTLMCVVFIANIRLMIEARFWTVIFSASFLLTFVFGFYALLLTYQARIWVPNSNNAYFYVFEKALSYGTHWLLFFAIVIVATLPDLVLRTVFNVLRGQAEAEEDVKREKKRKPSGRETSRPSSLVHHEVYHNDSSNDLQSVSTSHYSSSAYPYIKESRF